MNPLDLDTASIWYGILRLPGDLATASMFDVHELVNKHRGHIYQLTL